MLVFVGPNLPTNSSRGTARAHKTPSLALAYAREKGVGSFFEGSQLADCNGLTVVNCVWWKQIKGHVLATGEIIPLLLTETDEAEKI